MTVPIVLNQDSVLPEKQNFHSEQRKTMDFSTAERALESLGRRRPPLEDCVVQISRDLLAVDCTKEVYFNGILALLQQSLSQRWEGLAVGVYLTTDLLLQHLDGAETIYIDGPRAPTVREIENYRATKALDVTGADLLRLSQPLLLAATLHLEHSEPRIRTLVAKAVGALVRLSIDQPELGVKPLYDHIIESLYEHLDVGRDVDGKYSQTSAGALDDTTGWRALETNWQGLASYIGGLGAAFFERHVLTPRILEACEYSCMTHVNRHVRAAGIVVLEQWITVAPTTMLVESPLRNTIVTVLKVTLGDNWSQVRMAASVLNRKFWIALLEQLPEEKRNTSALNPVLIPRMCLNRFYMAQGVKLYSVETWKIVFADGKGLDAVAATTGAVCRYYIKMCDADNHAVREAACQAIAELAQKIGSHPEYGDRLIPYVPTLLQALLMCFHDESWPVRDEACLACGIFCKAYPQECLPELPTLKARWYEQLTDQIWSVRQDAAVAIGDSTVAYPSMMEDVISFVKKMLPSAREQPAMSKEEYKNHTNNMEMHTDSQLYSCGSLAPKLRKGGAGRIGCSSCGITRPKAPWEATDGCIYLLRELILLDKLEDDVLVPLMQEMEGVCRVKHFPQGDDVRATLWRQLPAMASALGKQRFKRVYLDMFLDLLFNTIDDRTASALSKHSAGQCAEDLSVLVGESIFLGRLDDFQRESFARVIQDRQAMPKGPMSDGLSPFGPPGLIDPIRDYQQ